MSPAQSKCCCGSLTLCLPLFQEWLHLSNFVITGFHAQMEKLRLLKLLCCLEHKYIAKTLVNAVVYLSKAQDSKLLWIQTETTIHGECAL